MPVFLLATDIRPTDAAWVQAGEQAASLAGFAQRSLGIEASVEVTTLPSGWGEASEPFALSAAIRRAIDADVDELFVLPTPFDLNLRQRAALGEELAAARRGNVRTAIHHDLSDPGDPYVVEAIAAQVLAAIGKRSVAPAKAGILLVAEGDGDANSRANSYRLLRLIWERSGVAQGAVGFVRHDPPSLASALGRCATEDLDWFLVAQNQWGGELWDRARKALDEYRQTFAAATRWEPMEPLGNHPLLQAWLERRVRALWQSKRAQQALRVPSAKRQAAREEGEAWAGDRWTGTASAEIEPARGIVARAADSKSLSGLLELVVPRAERYLVKVTWHGYAQGTFTSAAALDRLLAALPGKAVIVEGHTSGRNLGGEGIDWEGGAREHRTWIRQQDMEFLRRTGLSEVIAKHGAQYVNVTEEWWDGACETIAAPELVKLSLAQFVPSILLELRGCPMISFARFKGPTRLSLSNLFGLIPVPLRTEWHGARVQDFASVCCDLALLYGTLFPLYGLVEGFESAVRWERRGLYRSRWGNYDLVLTDGLFTLSEGPVGADILASRLQGQNVNRSAFYDEVQRRLGWPQGAIDFPLPPEVQATLA